MQLNNFTGEVQVGIVQHFRDVFPFVKDHIVPDDEIKYLSTSRGNYTGQLNEFSQKHGWGEMLWANGTLYGPADIFYYTLGDKYLGQWQKDLQEGIHWKKLYIVCPKEN